MKKKKIVTSILLCAAILLTCVAGGIASADDSVSAGDSFAADLSAWGTQGNNGWYYMYKAADGVYREMDYRDGTSAIEWQRDAFASDPNALGEMFFISRTACFTGENGTRPVYAFRAPATGTVTLRMQTHSTSPMRMQVYLGNVLQQIDGQDSLTLCTTGPLPGAMTATELTLQVLKDQMIYVEFYTTNKDAQRQAWVNEYRVTYTSVSDTVAGMTFAPSASAWGTQGNNGWYYLYKGTTGIYRMLDYYDGTAAIDWQRGAFAFDPAAMGEMLFINRNSFFTGENGSLPVYMYKAAATGTLRLDFETHGPSDLHVRVMHNRSQVAVGGAETVTFGTGGYTPHSVEIAVTAGDNIYLECFTTGSNREGWLRNYSVTYLTAAEEEQLSYEPDLIGNWGMQGNNGWHYFYQDLITKEYTELPFVTSGEDFTDCFSAHSVFPFCFITRETVHPAVNANAVKAFCAPAGGTVRFDIDIYRAEQPVAGSPSLLRVFRGGEQIFPENGAAYEIPYITSGNNPLEITTGLAAGEWVYFVISCNGSNDRGTVLMSEKAQYTATGGAALEQLPSAPSYEGFQIRDGASGKDMRFIFSLPQAEFGEDGETENYTILEAGSVWAAKSALNGRELNAATGTRSLAEYLNSEESGKLKFYCTLPSVTDYGTVYCVRPFLGIRINGTERTVWGKTVSASVRDYLASTETACGAVTNPVSANLSTGVLSSAQGSISVSPAYIAKSSYHSVRSIYSTSVSGSTVTARASGGTVTLNTEQTADGSFRISQTASVTSGGIGGIGLSVSFSMDYDVILPAWGGVRLTRQAPDAAPYPNDSPRDCIEYPLEWDAQMFLIQGANGGWLVYQDDNASQFKRLWFGNNGTNFNFTIETVPQAPFSAYSTFTANPWVFVAYEGDWTVGAALYKKYADEKFGMEQINAAKPDWIDDIQSMVLTDLNSGTMPMLRELAKETDASQTVLIVPGWRASLYDVNYPDYTAANGLKAYIDEAHELGYRVFVHANLIGCDDDSPDYANYHLEDDRYLNCRTGNPYLESWTSSYSVSFWLINPASPDWQDLLVSRLTEVYNTLGVDGFHLDQSLLAYNDNRGYVNGMTSMQGVIELERKLAAALPSCGFSGEGSTEINFRYANFLQRAPYGINSGTGLEWNDSKISRILPLDALLFGGSARLYHYPAMPTSASVAAYDAWNRAGMRMGALPTLMRSSAYELLVPTIATQKAVSLFRWYQENKPVLNYDLWSERDGFIAYRTVNGTTEYWKESGLW